MIGHVVVALEVGSEIVSAALPVFGVLRHHRAPDIPYAAGI